MLNGVRGRKRLRLQMLAGLGAVLVTCGCSHGSSETAAAPREELEQLHTELNTTDLKVVVVAGQRSEDSAIVRVYVVTVTNRGPNPSSSTLLEAVLSDKAAVTWTDPACVRKGRSILCELGELVAGESSVVNLETTPKDTGVPFELVVSVTNRFGPDLRPEDNVWTHSTSNEPEPRRRR